VQDILRELLKPGRDPRPEFKTAQFSADVHKIGDLAPGMVLEGVVTNVAAFGAFIDIGVHQDGLAHVSELSDKYIKDPREVVKTGQIVKVRVLEVDAPRKRIALSLKLTVARDAPTGERRGSAAPPSGRPQNTPGRGGPGGNKPKGGQAAAPVTTKPSPMGTLGNLLSEAMKAKR
jgi:uncharacterized protein